MYQMKLVERESGQMSQKELDDMERCAAFIARMIEQYGEEILAEIEAEDRVKSEKHTEYSEGNMSSQLSRPDGCGMSGCEHLVKTNEE